MNTRAERLEEVLPTLLRRMFADASPDQISNLTLAQLRILRSLLDGPRTAGEVADMLGYSASGLSQLSRRLISAGLLEKSVDADDARVRRLALSAKGRRLMEDRRKSRVNQADKVLSRLSEEEQQQFIRLLDKLYLAADRERWTVPLERITA